MSAELDANELLILLETGHKVEEAHMLGWMPVLGTKERVSYDQSWYMIDGEEALNLGYDIYNAWEELKTSDRVEITRIDKSRTSWSFRMTLKGETK